jgi:hypothetical protein
MKNSEISITWLQYMQDINTLNYLQSHKKAQNTSLWMGMSFVVSSMVNPLSSEG